MFMAWEVGHLVNMMRKKEFEIRNAIIASLRQYPKTEHELSGDTKLAHITVKRHLLYLQSLGTITTGDFKRADKKPLWMLRKQ